MKTHDYQLPNITANQWNAEPAAPTNLWYTFLAGATGILFVLAVGISSVTIRSSYHLSELDAQRAQLQAKEQVLHEQLAQQSAYPVLEAYAQAHGLTQSTEYHATLSVTTPVAQR